MFVKSWKRILCAFSIGVLGGTLCAVTAAGEGISALLIPCILPVSYTHLDVYKRQHQNNGYPIGAENRFLRVKNIFVSVQAKLPWKYIIATLYQRQVVSQ